MSEGLRFTLLGYQAALARPASLLLLLLAAAVAALALRAALRRRRQVQSLVGTRFLDALAPGVSVARPVVRSAFAGLGLALFAFALAQPRCGTRSELVKRTGIDVVVALDASKSMLARDVAPSRLDRAKLELMTLLDELKGDRVALVVFAGEAFIQCPLTADYEAAKLFLRAVDPSQMPQGGTNLGDALLTARQVIEGADHGAKDKVVVLLSDGEDVVGDVAPGLEAAKEAGIRVFAVGIGSESGDPIPLTGRNGEHLGYQKDRFGQTVVTRLDRATLVELAEETGGEFFHQPRGVAMGQVVERIDKLQKSELESRIAVRYDERYQPFALAGLVALALAALIPGSRRVPSRGTSPVAVVNAEGGKR